MILQKWVAGFWLEKMGATDVAPKNAVQVLRPGDWD